MITILPTNKKSDVTNINDQLSKGTTMSFLKDGGNMMLLRSIKLSKRLELDVMHKSENTFPACNDVCESQRETLLNLTSAFPFFRIWCYKVFNKFGARFGGSNLVQIMFF
jgi:hypothetical protein